MKVIWNYAKGTAVLIVLTAALYGFKGKQRGHVLGRRDDPMNE